MKCYLLSILSLFLAIITYGQPIQTDRLISKKDSILLNSFWAEFKKAINTNNKNELASLCVFPFYCAPCRNDSLFKGNNETAIKITKQLFVESQYKVFLADSVKKEVNDFRSYLVSTFDQKGFMFIYHLKGPRENWEGIQGIIYLYKLKGNTELPQLILILKAAATNVFAKPGYDQLSSAYTATNHHTNMKKAITSVGLIGIIIWWVQ